MNRFLRVATLVVFAVHGAMALAGTACPTIGMAPASLPNGDLATAYTSTVTSSGGAAPIVIDITHGLLPNGVNLTDNGNGSATFSGTATQAGTFEFTITATDANGCSGGRTYAPTFAAASQTISFTSTAPVGATVGGPTYNVTATATSGLPVAFTIDASASAVCSIAGSTVSFIGVGTCVIDANQAGNASYGPAPQVQQSFAVGQGAQTITFTSTAPAAATVGGATYTATATASSGLPVTLTIDATASAICSIAGSTVSFTAVGTCVIDANQAGDANYTPATQVQQSFAVGQGSQTITFTSTAPAAATVGGPTYTVTATGGASGNPVTFTIDATATSVCSIAGSTVSFIAAGTCVIDANQAGNANYAAATQVQQSFAVGKANQTITFTSTAPVGAVVGGATYTVTATGGASGNPVTFTIDATASTVCTIAGSTVSFIGAGTCVIDANQAGNANYNAAPQVQQSFVVGKGNQTITFTSTAPVGATVGGATYNVTATGGASGNPVTFTIDATASTVCTIAGSTVSFIGAGTCVIDANQAGNANYNAAPQVQQSMTVGPGSQTITFTSTAPVGAKFGDPPYTVTATASSGLPVTFTIDATASTVCSIAGSTVSFIGVGTCVIDANQAGNANYSAAPQVQQSFAVAKGDQTITFTSTPPAGVKVNDPAYTVTATSSAGLTVTFSLDASSTGCSLAGSSVTFTAGGTCVINANQAGNANYNAAPQVQQSFVVAKLDQAITFTSSAPVNAKVGGATYAVTATSSSGLTVTFTSGSTACNVAGPTVSFVHAATCIVNADQAGNAQYNAAPQVQQSFAVAKGDQTINVSTTAPTFGSASASATPHTYAITATATSGLAVAFSTSGACTNASNLVTFGPGAGTCTINADQAGNADWNAAPQVQQSTTVEIPASATGDSHAVTGNVAIAALTSVMSNDSGTAIAIKSYGVNGNEQTSIGTATATAQGGSVTLVAAGSYSYDPPPNFTGTDTFKYIIGNDLAATSTGTVTLTITDRIMIVATAGVGAADCKRASACVLSTADAKTAPTGRDLVFVQSGGYTAPNATITLNANQNLVGNFVSLAQAITDAGITLAAESVGPAAIAASTTPTLTNAGNVITLGDGNLVEYFSITNSAGSAILGNAAGAGTSNIHDIAVTDGANAGNGVNITANVGTLNFSNLIVTTSSAGAFAATGGGTINATQNNTTIVNTLSSTTGTALNVANTTIGASGLTFRSISANGGSKGIVLNNTGASGGLTVSGNGGLCDSTHISATDCTGGTIQGGTTRGAEFANAVGITLKNMYFKGNGTTAVACVDDISSGPDTACNANIHLTSVSTVAIDHVYVDGTGSNDMGILGNAVSALTLNVVEVANHTNTAKVPIVLQNLSGTCPFTSLNLHNNTGIHTVFVTQNTGTSTITFTSPTLTNNFGASNPDQIQVDAYNSANITVSATNVNISSSSINTGNGVSFQASSGSTMNATLNGGTVTGTNGILMDSSGTGTQFTYLVNGLTNISNHNLGSAGITVGKGSGGAGSATTGSVTNNTITSATCGGGCFGIKVASFGAGGSASATVTGNNISGVDGSGIAATAGQGATATTTIIQNNNIHNPALTQPGNIANSSYALDLIAGTQSGDAPCFFVNIGDMSVGHTVPANKNTITGAWGGVAEVVEFNNSVFKILNLSGGAGPWVTASNNFTPANTDATQLGTVPFQAGSSCP